MIEMCCCNICILPVSFVLAPVFEFGSLFFCLVSTQCVSIVCLVCLVSSMFLLALFWFKRYRSLFWMFYDMYMSLWIRCN